MKVTRFEELIAWQKARALANKIYMLTKRGDFTRDFGLSGQMQRAAVSVMSNIAEGFDRNKLTEFHRVLTISKGSCAELRSQAYIASDIGYLKEEHFREILSDSEELSRIIGALRISVGKRRDHERSMTSGRD